MGYEIGADNELLVSEAYFSTRMLHHEDIDGKPVFSDLVSLRMMVRALNTDRTLEGEITLISQTAGVEELYRGYWAFYTPDRFSAEIFMTGTQIERIWGLYSNRPENLVFTIELGPPVPALATNFEGSFRIECRAFLSRPNDD